MNFCDKFLMKETFKFEFFEAREQLQLQLHTKWRKTSIGQKIIQVNTLKTLKSNHYFLSIFPEFKIPIENKVYKIKSLAISSIIALSDKNFALR